MDAAETCIRVKGGGRDVITADLTIRGAELDVPFQVLDGDPGETGVHLHIAFEMGELDGSIGGPALEVQVFRHLDVEAGEYSLIPAQIWFGNVHP